MTTYSTQPTSPSAPTPTIADGYTDLLQQLTPEKRRGIVSQLTIGYYDGWRPSRREVADLVAVELGMLRWDEAAERQRLRDAGRDPGSLVPQVLSAAPPRRMSA
jgi:hypothetical protein